LTLDVTFIVDGHFDESDSKRFVARLLFTHSLSHEDFIRAKYKLKINWQ